MQIVELIRAFLMTGVFDRSKPLPIGDGLCQVNRYIRNGFIFHLLNCKISCAKSAEIPELNEFKNTLLSAERACTVFTRISAAGAYLIFRATSAALIRGRRLFKHCTRQIYFFYIFIQRHTFYLLIFLWTDTKLIVNLELREKFTR